jgi:1,4-dihydroxy-2-naphthoate octaprenyltransferase
LIDSPPLSRRTLWIGGLRIPTLPAAIVPVVVGTGLAISHHHFWVGPFIGTLAAALLIQVGTNLTNDYADFKKGADGQTRLGPPRMSSSGLIPPRQVATAATATFFLAGLLGIYLTVVAGWPLLVIGAASILAGIAYTAGPYPLGYHGWGDAFTYVFFGFIAVCGTYYVQAHDVTLQALIAAIPVGALVTAILVVNNLRDARTDRQAGKMTLAARYGQRVGRLEFAALLTIAYLSPLALLLTGASRWLFWLPFLSLPIAVGLLRRVNVSSAGPVMNAALKQAGQLELVYGLLLTLSFIR